MGTQDKYDELDNIISTLNVLISEVNDVDYKFELEYIRDNAEKEIKEVEDILRAEAEAEMKEANRQYETSQF